MANEMYKLVLHLLTLFSKRGLQEKESFIAMLAKDRSIFGIQINER
jgi:hypothetical protein